MTAGTLAPAVHAAPLLAALDGWPFGAARLAARSAGSDERTAAGAWVGCAGGLMVAPRRAGGELLRCLGDDGRPDAGLAVAALARLEPMVAAVEAALGAELLPQDVVEAPGADDLVIAIAAGDDALMLAVSAATVLAPTPAPPDPARPVAWQVRLAGPAAGRPAALARGDLLLGFAGGGQLVAGGRAAPARWTGEAVLVTGAWGEAASVTAAAVTAEIDGGSAPLGTLLALAPGDRLAPTGDITQVRLCAGAVAIAVGRLLPVGCGLAVLIEDVAG